MSKHHLQSEGMKALEQSLNDHMEICRLQRKAKRLKTENVRLKAEVERLRKAGDALASALILFEMKSEEERQDRIKAWSAAKEGKQP